MTQNTTRVGGKRTVEDACCPACGVVLPGETVRLDAVPKQEHAKRAIEVALVGSHPICFIGVGNGGDALRLARWVRQQGVAAFTTAPCPCGNVGDAVRTCVCTTTEIHAWRQRSAYHAALGATLVVEVPSVTPEQIAAVLRGRLGESDETVRERIAWARARPLPGTEIDGAGQRLLVAAIRQLALDTMQTERMLTIARTIARMAGVARVGPAHLAEAMQYRPRTHLLAVLEPLCDDELV